MAKAKFKIKVDGYSFDSNEFLSALSDKLIKRLNLYNTNVTTRIKNVARRALENSDFYKQFTPLSSLVGELGIPFGEEHSRMLRVVEVLVNNILYHFTPVTSGGKFLWSMEIWTVVDSQVFALLAQLNEAIVKTNKGEELNWVDWTLTKGSRIVIGKYHVSPMVGLGRSTVAIMRKGGFWKVPSAYAGTLGDNWITRAFEADIDEFADVIQDVFIRELNKISHINVSI